MSGPDQAVLDVLYREAMLLDDGELEAWLELYTEDCIYWIPSEQGDTDPRREVSIVYDDKRRLGGRVARLLSGKEYGQDPPSVTCHQLSNIVAGNTSDDKHLEVAAVQVVYEKRLNTSLQVLPGRVHWRLRRDGGSIRVVEKRIDLVDVHYYYENLTFVL